MEARCFRATRFFCGAIRPVLDRVFLFERLNVALAYIDSGCAKGEAVVSLKPSVVSH